MTQMTVEPKATPQIERVLCIRRTWANEECLHVECITYALLMEMRRLHQTLHVRLPDTGIFDD